jgi:hypothetical protein
VVALIHLLKLQMSQEFIDLLHVASLDDVGMAPEDLEALCNPELTMDIVYPSPLLQLIRHFFNNTGCSQDHFDNLQAIVLLNNPNDDLLSFDQSKRRVRLLSGVVSLEHDMCPNSCITYTSPYKALDNCLKCQTSWYHHNSQKPRKLFSMTPIGPVIQAFYGSCKVADKMYYLEKKLAENVETIRLGGQLPVYNDTTCGSDLLKAWSSGHFGKSDITFQLYIDGA